MPNYYFIQFDGELMFHNDRQMVALAKFRDFDNKKDVVLAFINNKKLIDEYFIDDYGECIRFPFRFDMHGKYSDALLEQNLEFYRENPDEFLKDMETTWQKHEMNAYALVNENETMFKILFNSKAFEKSPIRVIKNKVFSKSENTYN